MSDFFVLSGNARYGADQPAALVVAFDANMVEYSRAVPSTDPLNIGDYQLECTLPAYIVAHLYLPDKVVGVWRPNTAYTAGDIVFGGYASTTSSSSALECIISGTSGASEPAWGGAGDTAIDGTAEWVALGSIEGTAPSMNVYHPNFAIGNIAPPANIVEGGNTVTVWGVGFFNFDPAVDTITFRGNQATNVILNDDTSITCDVPLNPSAYEGLVDVTVTVSGGARSYTLKDGYEYGGSVQLTFYESRYGSDVSDLGLYVVDSATGEILETLREIPSADANLGTAAWQQVQMTYFHPGVPHRLAFLHQGHTSYRGDYAVDSISLAWAASANWTFETLDEGFLMGSNSSDPVVSLANASALTTNTTHGSWGRGSGVTGSSSTGPSSAYEGTYYAYTETSGNYGYWMWLFSPEIT